MGRQLGHRWWDWRWLSLAFVLLLSTVFTGRVGANEVELADSAKRNLRQYCFDCHGNDLAEVRINLERMVANPDFGRGFKDWEKVVSMLRQRRMPPKDELQPADEARASTIAAISDALESYISQHAGDPGEVVLRRLTSAEFGYTIQDLTGLDLKLERRFVSDAVGAEGFTNVGGAQFIQDSTLEQYLEAAKAIADHAVIGAGPLTFYEHPGQTGLELSAITRIQDIYRRTGFRTAAGEGAKPFGLDLYPRAMLVAWRFRHKMALGQRDVALEKLARDEGISVRLCTHIASVFSQSATSFPLSVIVSQWQAIPAPSLATAETEARAACERIGNELRQWQSVLAAAAGDEEEASVLTEGEVTVQPKHSMQAEIDWTDGFHSAEFELSVSTASKHSAAGAFVVWRKPRIRFVHADRRRGEITSLVPFLAPETATALRLGRHPAGATIEPSDFVFTGETKIPFRIMVPDGMIAARLYMDVELDTEHGADAIVRCRISDGAVAGETAAEVGDTSTLLGNPQSPAVAEWQAGVAEFARLLPEVSHREPTPSDRDPIPAPYDNTYNMPERNHFHSTIKYHRDDRFLVEHVLDDATRVQLDQAWTDLLMSFEYHDANLRFAAKKFGVDLGDRGVSDLEATTVRRFPEGVRGFVQHLQNEYTTMRPALQRAEPQHVDDAVRFAQRAWRRPLTGDEERRLREFYVELRKNGEFDHTRAIRALLARILIAPASLYRAEPTRDQTERPNEIVELSDWELASRLSYFLWSSLPDKELLRAAAAGETRNRDSLALQARRMATDPKARRFATEFFGQWLGYYRFDEYRGIDAGRFPEFNEALRTAMYDEAVSFFEHIVRESRPASEILFADYTFLNASLARHYGIESSQIPENQHVRVAELADQHRGGLLGMAAVLAPTSAPLRTSAVKRGDWIVRRVLGTPVPPQPADVGSISADDVSADKLTVRQRLEAHRRDATCNNCHSRIDPLGFALEHYDPIGRWREQYRDGQAIDSSGVLNDGTEINGLDDLRQYLRRQQPQFERNLCGKLVGYALGRAELASDRPLIEEMLAELKEDGGIADLLVCIVTSKQFRYRR